MRKSRLI